MEAKKYHVVFSVEYGVEAAADQVRIPPFEEIEMDLRYVFGTTADPD